MTLAHLPLLTLAPFGLRLAVARVSVGRAEPHSHRTRRIMNIVGGISSALRSLRERSFAKYGIPRVHDGRISKAVVQRYLPPSPVVVDCGAHDGTDTAEMAQRWPSARLYAFEPVPELYAR